MFHLNQTIVLSIKKQIPFAFVFTRNKYNYKSLDIKKCCSLLEVSSHNLTHETLKSAFLSCCKRFHPDVSINHDDSKRFILIKKAYQDLKEYLNEKESQEKIRENACIKDELIENEDDESLKHVVPQHRQYLSFDGVGFGTPNARFKQYQAHRLNRATQTIHEFQLEKLKAQGENMTQEEGIILRDVNLQRQIKTKQGFDRLVEDLIQEAMAKGDFDDLPGRGKPLRNKPEIPYVDSTTYKLNEILINNGFVPEWVRLEREINNETNVIREELKQMWIKDRKIVKEDERVMDQIKRKVKEINFKIDKYNSLVPILNKQKFHFMLTKEIDKVKSMSVSDIEQEESKNLSNKRDLNSDINQPKGGLLDLVISIFFDAEKKQN